MTLRKVDAQFCTRMGQKPNMSHVVYPPQAATNPTKRIWRSPAQTRNSESFTLQLTDLCDANFTNESRQKCPFQFGP